MRFRLRKHIDVGPVRVNLTQKGVSSFSLKLGRWTWNSKRGWTYDSPGPGSVKF